MTALSLSGFGILLITYLSFCFKIFYIRYDALHFCYYQYSLSRIQFIWVFYSPAVTVIVAVTSASAFVALNVKVVFPAATAVIVATPSARATVAVAGVPETTFNPSSSAALDTVIVSVAPTSIEDVALSMVITFLD
jgi:hypothetical protein